MLSELIRGFKAQLSRRDATEIDVNPNECDPQVLDARQENFEFYRASVSVINKRYINTNSKNRTNQLPEKLQGRLLLDSQTKATIQTKIDVSNCHKSKVIRINF